MTKTRRSQEDRRQETRKKLIDATIKVINEKGFAAMRTTDITKKAGVTWGAAQHIFGGKAELLSQVAANVSETLIDVLEADVSLDISAEAKLATMIDQTWNIYSGDVYFAMVEILRGTRKDPNIHDHLVEAQRRITKKIESLWVKIFSQNKLTETEVLKLCNTVTLYLAGLAARKNYFLPGTETTEYVEYIKELSAAELNRLSRA